jgi:hypothetical protein
VALGSTQPLTYMSTRNLPGGKGRLACKADNLAARLSRKCGSLDVSQHDEPPRPARGIAVPFFNYILNYKYTTEELLLELHIKYALYLTDMNQLYFSACFSSLPLYLDSKILTVILSTQNLQVTNYGPQAADSCPQLRSFHQLK